MGLPLLRTSVARPENIKDESVRIPFVKRTTRICNVILKLTGMKRYDLVFFFSKMAVAIH